MVLMMTEDTGIYIKSSYDIQKIVLSHQTKSTGAETPVPCDLVDDSV